MYLGPPQQYSGQEDYYGEQYSHGGQGPAEGINQQYYPEGNYLCFSLPKLGLLYHAENLKQGNSHTLGYSSLFCFFIYLQPNNVAILVSYLNVIIADKVF